MKEHLKLSISTLHWEAFRRELVFLAAAVVWTEATTLQDEVEVRRYCRFFEL